MAEVLPTRLQVAMSMVSEGMYGKQTPFSGGGSGWDIPFTGAALQEVWVFHLAA